MINPVDPKYVLPGCTENKDFGMNFGKDQVFFKPKGKKVFHYTLKKKEEIAFDIISNKPLKYHYLN